MCRERVRVGLLADMLYALDLDVDTGCIHPIIRGRPIDWWGIMHRAVVCY